MRWRHRPEGSNWGEFGPDDQIGRMNLVTAEKVRQGIAEVREGLTFCLSLPLDYPGGRALVPHRQPPRLFAVAREDPAGGEPVQGYCFPLRDAVAGSTDVICDDAVLLSTQYSTQWDSLAHAGRFFDADGDGIEEAVFYNGYRAGEDIVPAPRRKTGEAWAAFEGPRAKALGIEKLAEHGVQGRGVMIDLHHHVHLEPRAIGYDELMRILDADKVTVETGDMVCLHTGFAEFVMSFRRNPDPQRLHHTGCALDGRDTKLLQWITDSGLACLIADNMAVELYRPALFGGMPHSALPLHEHCLFKNGIYLGELWHLTPLANWLRERRRNGFLLTAPPLRLPGAVGSPATPIATV